MMRLILSVLAILQPCWPPAPPNMTRWWIELSKPRASVRLSESAHRFEPCNSRSDWTAHGLVGNAEKASRDLLRSEFIVLFLVDLFGKGAEKLLAGLDVKGFILVGTKDFGAKMGER